MSQGIYQRTPKHLEKLKQIVLLCGTNYIWNIQPLCISCNVKKHDKIIDFRPIGTKIVIVERIV